MINCYGGYGSVRDHATMMGMLLPEDEKYLWIAEESLFAHLPEGTICNYFFEYYLSVAIPAVCVGIESSC